MIQPLIIGVLVDVLAELGVGGSVVVAVVLGVIAFEGYRVLALGRRAGGAVTNVMWYVIVILAAIAAVILLGWADPNPSAFAADVSTFGGMVLDWVVNAAQGVIGR